MIFFQSLDISIRDAGQNGIVSDITFIIFDIENPLLATRNHIMSELELFEEIKKGSMTAYETMFLKFYTPLQEYASQFVCEDDAQELVLDLMTYIWETREDLIITTSLKSYLFIAVKNRAFNAIRKEKYREKARSRLFDHLNEQQIDNPDFYMINELEVMINNAISELPENYRSTFEMSRFARLSNAEIAESLDVSIKTVEYRITRSLKILRLKLKDYITFNLFLF